jgi:hypothetical protein
MPGVFLDFALHARSLLFMNMFCSMAKCSSIIQSYHIKALTPGMEFKSELFHPTKIKIKLTSFENFENELFTILIKKL